MRRFLIPTMWQFTLIMLLIGLMLFDSPVRAAELTRLKKFEGAIGLSTEGPAPFTLQGKTRELGKFTAFGEVDFVPGEVEGSLIGEGVAVFEAANGDLLTGVVLWEIAADGDEIRTTRITFSWRDGVEFSDGTIVTNTGKFIHKRPPGLVVIAIIAILIGLLLPAVQKVREQNMR